MDAQARLLCYPRGSFYPLSSRPPIWPSRIIRTDFRPCSIRRCCSQASLYPYAFLAISIRKKLTVASLRYSLAGYRPSKTVHLASSLNPFSRLLGKTCHIPKGGVTLATRLTGSPSYTRQSECTNQCQITVKLHGVFLSWWK